MLNKKGTTLIELIISIALISVILVFMVRLLIDLNNAETNDIFAKDNQMNRSEIIRMIENDLTGKTLNNILDSSSDENNFKLVFKFDNGSESTINATKESFIYTNTDGETRKWTMENASIYTNKAIVYHSNDVNISAISINIEIHTINEKNTIDNNNSLDDIIISYVGPFNSNLNKNCFGKGC